jgi:serine protease AprX
MACTKKTRWFLLAGILISGSLHAQVNRYMVFFKDKTGTPYTTANPIDFLSQKAIDRRIKQGVTVDERDLPVNNNYIQAIKDVGANVFFTSRWMNGVLVQCDASMVPSFQQLPFVDHVEFVAPNEKLQSNGRKKKINLRKNNSADGAQTQSQLAMLGIPDMHADGFTGGGITIAVLDAGFNGVNVVGPFQHLFDANLINTIVSKDFVYNSDNVFQYDEHGTEVLSVIAAQIPDVFTGGAYDANFQLYVTEDDNSEYRIEEYNWLFAAERADSAGADIIQSSLGYYDFDDASMNYSKAQMDGKTAVVTKAAQWAADRGIVVVCSAGNEGNVAWKIISAPADAVDVLAVGNVDLEGKRNPSSSIGPSADGRIKPDVSALGTGVKVIKPNGSLSSASGTSLSAPLITSLVAGMWQRFPYLTNKELMGLIRYTASRGKNPDNSIGYGIPNYKSAEAFQASEEKERVFKIFPNPMTDTITIGPVNPEAVGTCRVEVISVQGQLLGEETLTFDLLSNNIRADVSHLAAGMYYLRFWFGGKKYLFKVVKV